MTGANGSSTGPAAVSVAAALLLLAPWLPAPWDGFVFALTVALLPAALLLLAARRGGSAARVALPAALLLGVGMLALLLLDRGEPLGRWVLGLPLALAAEVWLLALLPLCLLGWVFWRLFPLSRPDAETLREVRSLAAERERRDV